MTENYYEIEWASVERKEEMKQIRLIDNLVIIIIFAIVVFLMILRFIF